MSERGSTLGELTTSSSWRPGGGVEPAGVVVVHPDPCALTLARGVDPVVRTTCTPITVALLRDAGYCAEVTPWVTRTRSFAARRSRSYMSYRSRPAQAGKRLATRTMRIENNRMSNSMQIVRCDVCVHTAPTASTLVARASAESCRRVTPTRHDSIHDDISHYNRARLATNTLHTA